MDETEISAEGVAAAVGDALRNEALQEAVLVFGSTRFLLTKGQRLGAAEPVEADTLPEYPPIDTSLTDDENSWLS